MAEAGEAMKMPLEFIARFRANLARETLPTLGISMEEDLSDMDAGELGWACAEGLNLLATAGHQNYMRFTKVHHLRCVENLKRFRSKP